MAARPARLGERRLRRRSSRILLENGLDPAPARASAVRASKRVPKTRKRARGYVAPREGLVRSLRSLREPATCSVLGTASADSSRVCSYGTPGGARTPDPSLRRWLGH